jgi:metal-dependent amidase/aminoacylase/carboxypeptidase family protein
MRVTVHGRGAQGLMPQAAVDPVVLAAMIVVRLQTIMGPHLPRDDARRAGSADRRKRPSRHQEQRDHRLGDDSVQRAQLLRVNALGDPGLHQTHGDRGVRCIQSSRSRLNSSCFDQFPFTDNDPATCERVAAVFADQSGERPGELPLQTASEDFSDLPKALGVPYTNWNGGADPNAYAKAVATGRISHEIPVDHSAKFAPVLQPTLDTGTTALVVAAVAWLGTDGQR